MNRSTLIPFILLMACRPSSDGASTGGASVARADEQPNADNHDQLATTLAVYQVIAPEIKSVVEGSWGTPREWNRPAHEKTTVTLDLRLERPNLGVPVSDSTGNVVLLDSAFAKELVRKGYIDQICTDAKRAGGCTRGITTMVVALSTITWSGDESATVMISMYRETFASRWELHVTRSSGMWIVKSRQLRMIT